MINIVGLGYGDVDELTVRTFKMLKSADNVFIKNRNHKIIGNLEEEGIKFKDYNKLLEDIVNYDEENESVVYAVLGSISGNYDDIKELINLCEEKNIRYKVHSDVELKSYIQSTLNTLIKKVSVINVKDIDKVKSTSNGIIITDINTRDDTLKVKSELINVYNEETSIYCIKSDDNTFKKINLKDIENNDFTIIYIPECSRGKKNINDLIEIVEVLRGENGCPWDKEQTHESIKKDIIEESYEVYDAIEAKNKNALIEELGDVLFQVMFHASLGNEKNEFDILDVTDGICKKMIYRHPHVFGNANVKDTAEVLVNWDELKKGEKNFESTTDELNGVAKALPALIRAKKVQKKAKKVGFDWDDVSGAFEKVKEELNEVIDVYKSEKMVRIKEEIGDLLFSCVNVSRFLNVDAEEALNLTTDKFIKRFSYIEEKAKQNNLYLEEMSLNDMDKLWNEAKKLENK